MIHRALKCQGLATVAFVKRCNDAPASARQVSSQDCLLTSLLMFQEALERHSRANNNVNNNNRTRKNKTESMMLESIVGKHQIEIPNISNTNSLQSLVVVPTSNCMSDDDRATKSRTISSYCTVPACNLARVHVLWPITIAL